MRFLLFLFLCAVMATGCKTNAGKAKADVKAKEKQAATERTKETVIPVSGRIGKIASVNASAKFAVIKFPIGQVPSKDQHFNVYRGGLKVGEIKISDPPPVDNLAVGDIVAGEAQVGDEAREQ